jgi:hypothetical protein
MNFGQFRHVVQGIVPPGSRLSFVVLESVAARHGRRRSKLVADLAAESGVGMDMEEELKMIAARIASKCAETAWTWDGHQGRVRVHQR